MDEEARLAELLPDNGVYEVWSPYESYDAARVLAAVLERGSDKVEDAEHSQQLKSATNPGPSLSQMERGARRAG